MGGGEGDLSPQHKDASDEIKALVEGVEAQKQDYIEVIVIGWERESMGWG